MDNPLRIIVRPAVHRNKPVLTLSFPYTKEVVEKVRALHGVLWSNSMKCWHIPDTAKSLGELRNIEGVLVILAGNNPAKSDQNILQKERMMIFIRGAKGKKDRYTILSRELLGWLRRYYREEKPETWLFEGVTGGQYSMRSVQSVMRDAVKRAGIKKHATVHTLRHSFATHMLENGTDLRYIQNLLGHNSSKTTEIYTHITTKGLEQLISPFDRLRLDEK